MAWYRWREDVLELTLRVQPRASRDEIVGPHGEDALKVRITAPPVEGKANAHLLKYMAKAFGVPRGAVNLLSGDTGRDKRIAIHAPSRFPDKLGIKAP